MGRPLRIEYRGVFYHVTSRGNKRRTIFLSQKNYERMIGYLGIGDGKIWRANPLLLFGD